MTCEEEEEEEDPCGSCSSCRDERTGAAELMDEYWFYHNMLKRTKVLKLKPSIKASCSRTSREMAVANSDIELPSTASTLPRDDFFVSPSLLRNPSLPPCMGRLKTEQRMVERHAPSRNSSLQRSFSSVDHTPLPSLRGIHRRPSQVRTPRPIFPRQPSRKDININDVNMDYKSTSSVVEANCSRAGNIKSWKSLSDLEIEELQGFMDLGFVFNKDEMNPSILNIIPGLQEKRPAEEDDPKVTRPYLSEAWLVQRSDPPKLNWVDRRSAVDMKEQLKAWARTVASNVRQEC
ncbi:putative Serine/arginine repetitive matrix protein 2 [Cinnamomum micranthum f. kanehirae]|uniref:Putative Serine/arginine repetitive matrix protein 2 n=1 Tax=Cinnamomum micranthum f. kanehirae TaxID=337451 RepID=A0A443PFS7_9MAGN|nr:putative Serine/arginine repetitive matrix protein 2 [Cinnamomum micranthum f. kanehirae]